MTSKLLNRDALLERLARAVTLDNGYLTDHLSSDLAMIKRVGAKFLGRAAHVWVTPLNDAERLKQAQAFATQVHDVDTDIVLQAAIFEAIFPAVERIMIPDWVFIALDEAPEARHFCFADMYSDLTMAPGQSQVWLDDGKVPDLTLPEAQRWFIYRAGCYLQAGYEALHLGQIHLVAARDRGYTVTADLISRIRRLATRFARRGEVMMDAHSHGIVRHGQLLLDFVSRPLSGRARYDAEKDRNKDIDEDLILQWKGGLASGWHSGGWYADEQPNLVEIDNWGGRCWPEESWGDVAGRAAQGRWGWDDISWFARRSDRQRAGFLQYAHRLCRLASPVNFFQPPLCRTLGNAPMSEYGPTATYYRANRQGDDCLSGRNDEDAVAALWAEPDPASCQLIPSGQPSVVSIPFPVLLLGNIQQELGGVINDTQCPYSRLDDLGQSCAGKTLVLPHPGEWSFVIAAGGTRMEPLGQGMSPGGEAWLIRTTEPAQMVRMMYDYDHRTFTAEDPYTGQSLLVS